MLADWKISEVRICTNLFVANDRTEISPAHLLGLSQKRTLGITKKWQTVFLARKLRCQGIEHSNEKNSHPTLPFIPVLTTQQVSILISTSTIKNIWIQFCSFFFPQEYVHIMILCRCFYIGVLLHFSYVLQIFSPVSMDTVVLWCRAVSVSIFYWSNGCELWGCHIQG